MFIALKQIWHRGLLVLITIRFLSHTVSLTAAIAVDDLNHTLLLSLIAKEVGEFALHKSRLGNFEKDFFELAVTQIFLRVENAS